MNILNFNYHKPDTIEEASRILERTENSVPLAGGTDLLVELKKGLRKTGDLISLTGLPELKKIFSNEDNIYIGACVTHTALIRSAIIYNSIPALVEAASKIGSEQIRNTGTIGGNLCTGASCADTAPILFAYDTSVELASYKNSRIVPLRKFFLSHHKIDIQKNEIMIRIIIPKQTMSAGASFVKFGLRDASSISVASSGVLIDFSSGICNNVRIVIGACAPTPVISENAQSLILGRTMDELSGSTALIELAADAAAKDSVPIDDIRGTAVYRKHLVKVLTKQALLKAIGRAKTGV
jgi:carbon-monoxide dehydrogenase medium subunit